MKKRWKVNPANKELQGLLSRELNILPLTAQLLVNRGLVDRDRAFSFMNPTLKDLHDPYLMKGMDAAVARIVAAVETGEKIAVYGDYDVDGTTSTALLHLFFKDLGVDTITYIPERLTEGYGLNEGAVRELAGAGVNVLITVDCGISNPKEVEYARSLGIDCVITDHHELSGEPPSASAVLNPYQPGCTFPFKGLAGVGVAFNLVIALRSALRDMGRFKKGEPNIKRYLDLVSIGTVADMVPLVDENRVFVKCGLGELDATLRPGLSALKLVAGVKPGRLDSDAIAFQLAPRINAAGRLDSASTALRLFLSNDEGEAELLARALDDGNAARRKIEEKIQQEAFSMVGDEPDRKALVLSSAAWHQGVVGIVASRVAGRFTRPTVMIAVDEATGMCKGSVRGVRGADVLEGVKASGEFLERFGGHKAAAGITVKMDNIEPFREAFTAYFDRTLSDDDLVPEVELDALVPLQEIDARCVSEIQQLAPFGRGNRKPILGLQDARIVKSEVVGRGHLRLMVKQNGSAIRAMGFGLADKRPLKDALVDIACYPYMNEWHGKRNIELRIEDLRPSSSL